MKRMSIFMFILAAASLLLAVWVPGMWVQFLASAGILFLTGTFLLGASESEDTHR